MALTKREFLKLAGIGSVAAVAGPAVADKHELSDITGDVAPISPAERAARVTNAQRLMKEHAIDALLIEPGSSMTYFSGLRWWRSERLTGLVIPREGRPAVVTPYFEEPSVQESLEIDAEVRTWHEDESPYKRVAEILKDRGLKRGRLGIEESVRYFVANGVAEAAPDTQQVPADPVVLGCRMFKDAHEIALMKKANEVTLTAYAHVYQSLQTGMSPDDVKALMRDAQGALGGSGIWGMALFGKASAYPHGTSMRQEIEEGQIVLMDCGCSVHDYRSDISRTFVFGEANEEQRTVWDTVRKGQQIAFETAKVGTPAGKVDNAVRQYYESMGYGPGYATPGLSHRTGHGIGMDVHESINFVNGETTPLAPGMCLSNEPGLYNFDTFGVRIEDCLYMTDDGAQWFTVPPDTIDAPIGKPA